ncbi:hypothetical protein D3C71_1475310 [compost metagenome]
MLRLDVRNQQQDAGQGDDAHDDDSAKRCPPAEMLADECPDRDANNVGDGQAGHHDRHGCCPAARCNKTGGDDGADAEERAMRQGGEEPRPHQHRVIRRQRSGGIAADEEDHQETEQPLLRQPVCQHGQNRRSDRHA